MANRDAKPVRHPDRAGTSARDLLAGRSRLARRGDSDRRLSPEHGAEVFTDGLYRIEHTAWTIVGIKVINV